MVGGSILAAPLAVAAQQTRKVPRIGVLVPAEPESLKEPNIAAFRRTLRDLSYVDGQNVAVEYRWAHGKAELYPELVTLLVGLNVDVLVVGSGPATLATKRATQTIPIVGVSMGGGPGGGRSRCESRETRRQRHGCVGPTRRRVRRKVGGVAQGGRSPDHARVGPPRCKQSDQRKIPARSTGRCSSARLEASGGRRARTRRARWHIRCDEQRDEQRARRLRRGTLLSAPKPARPSRSPYRCVMANDNRNLDGALGLWVRRRSMTLRPAGWIRAE